MASDFKTKLRQLDEVIRSGRLPEARAEVRHLTRKRVSREHLAAIAKIAERCEMPHVGVRLLHRLVYPSSGGPSNATPTEKAEYALCLLRLGAHTQALDVLSKPGMEKSALALLYRAAAHAAHWEYAKSIPCLTRYLATGRLSPYQKLVAETNLAAALVFERKTVQATALLRKLVHQTSVMKLNLLLANNLELSAEHFILSRKFREADKILERARSLLADSQSHYEFLALKWTLISSYMKGDTGSLDELRGEARKRGRWEVLRECDRFTVVKEKSQELALHLYFGTPFEAYRSRVLSDLGRKLSPPPHYEWRLGEGIPRYSLDLAGGKLFEGQRLAGSVRPGHLLHRFLGVLAGDFYRPQRIPSLHSRVHPGEFYHPDLTPLKMHQAIHDLRAWLSETKAPLQLEENRQQYSLFAKKAIVIRVPSPSKAASPLPREIEILRERFGIAWFTTAEAVSCLELPRRSIQRLLQGWTEKNLVEREGSGGYSRYRMPGPGGMSAE